ncbi:hypothetical protein KA005_74035 [bacterium]|nr:hypothetical protein [bacterium]
MTMIHRIILMIVITLTCVSCAATPSKTTSTPSRIYDAPPEKVYHAAIVAFQNLGLKLFKQDQNAGYIEGGRKPGFGRGAENVGVYIVSEVPGKTEVSIENRKAMLGYLFAVDWTDKLFQQISSELDAP